MVLETCWLNSYFKNDKTLKKYLSEVIDPLNALLNVYVSYTSIRFRRLVSARESVTEGRTDRRTLPLIELRTCN